MPTITYNGASFVVDHAVKGADYVHGYSAAGDTILSIDGISDFSVISYDGTFLAPDKCINESCNDLKFVNGALTRRDGTVVTLSDLGIQYGDTLPAPGIPGRIFLKKV